MRYSKTTILNLRQVLNETSYKLYPICRSFLVAPAYRLGGVATLSACECVLVGGMLGFVLFTWGVISVLLIERLRLLS